MRRTTIRIAFCGVLAALMLAVMLLGGMAPLATYACPALAGALVIPAVWEFGTPTGAVLYAAGAVLSLILCPDKEAASLFLFFLGWYPVLRPRLQHLQNRPIRLGVKLLLFNLSICLVYALLLFVFPLPDLIKEAETWTGLFLAGFLLLGNVAFLLYDLLLARVTDLYVYRLRPKLRTAVKH